MSKIFQRVDQLIDDELCTHNGGGFTAETLWSATLDTRMAAAKRVMASMLIRADIVERLVEAGNAMAGNIRGERDELYERCMTWDAAVAELREGKP